MAVDTFATRLLARPLREPGENSGVKEKAGVPHGTPAGGRYYPSGKGQPLTGSIVPQLAGIVASWGSEGSRSLGPAASSSYMPLPLRSTPCWTMANSPSLSATFFGTPNVRSYVRVPSSLATGKRSTASPLSGLVSPSVVNDVRMGP